MEHLGQAMAAEAVAPSPTPELAATTRAFLTPVEAQERIQTLDVLRGFALFGILWMNMPSFWEGTTFQRAFAQLGGLLASGKFITLYSFLFGLGFSVQLLRADARGARIVPVYLRRLFVLLLLGLAHMVLLWNGDILHDYALMGVVLLLVRRRSLRTLLVLAALCLVLNVFVYTAYERVTSLRRADPEVAQARALQGPVDMANRRVLWERQARAQQRGTYPELVATRAAMVPLGYSQGWSYFNGMIICMFLLGLYAGRRGIFHDTAAHLPFLRKLMWWALGIGFTLNLASVIGSELYRRYHFEWPQFVGEAIYTLGRPALCLFYASGIVLLLQKERWRQLLRPLSWAGRMGLTNYLLQSLIFTTLFYGYGFGLLPKASAPLALLLTLLTYPLQIALSMWWMRRFRFGPMEWLWRSLTYMKLQPMRVVRP
jgi:uncharacterized protein